MSRGKSDAWWKRVGHLLVAVRQNIHLAGGVGSMARKAHERYRTHGLLNLADRILRFLRTILNSARGNTYAKWVRHFDLLDDAKRDAIRQRIAGLAHKPVISVVMPTYNPVPGWLAEAIDSVRNQLYPHWELCIADDVSTDPAIRPLLERYASEDPRIKVVFREQNGHISAASNSALALATGEWVALLDHDDLLPEHALYWVADAINANPSARMIYSDEDKIDERMRRHDPYFKADWNIDLFYSQNMFSHLGVYSRALLEQIGGFRVGMEGSQDYDLALRSIEVAGHGAVHHIPRVLYHWRVHAASTASNSDAKPYAALAGERALNEHFARTGLMATAHWQGNGYRVRYVLPDELPLVSLIIPTRNGLQLMRQCIDSIRRLTTYSRYEIVIVDNGSDDPAAIAYFAELARQPDVRVIRDDRPFNYSSLNNVAVAQARGDLVALINNDIEVISPDWLVEMVTLALQPGVGAVGAKLLYPDESVQHAGVVGGMGGVAAHVYRGALRGDFGYFGRACLISTYSAVTAACLVIRKSIYEQVGGLNEQDLAVAYNDVDFCFRLLEAGYRNVYTPYAELFHHESVSRGTEDTAEKRARFERESAYMKRRWPAMLYTDPAYSPNLTLSRADASLAWPPRIEVL